MLQPIKIELKIEPFFGDVRNNTKSNEWNFLFSFYKVARLKVGILR